jgi:hypothetical protein
MKGHEHKCGNQSAADIIAAVERKQRKWKIGCLALVGGSVGLFIVAFIGSQNENEEWRAARPSAMTEGQWSQKREMCERVGLAPTECAQRPDREVTRQSNEILARELAELCQDNDTSRPKTEAEQRVLATLRAPSSADFISSATRTDQDGCVWTVTGEVDAQNAFGAQIRSRYRVKLRRTGRDSWLPLEVRVD